MGTPPPESNIPVWPVPTNFTFLFFEPSLTLLGVLGFINYYHYWNHNLEIYYDHFQSDLLFKASLILKQI